MPSSTRKSRLPALDELARLPKAELVAVYQHLLKAKPPPKARPEFLHRNIAWARQALAQGQNPLTLRKRLLNAAARDTSGRSHAPYKPGTRLIREWQGQVYEVTILEKGYLWNGREYRSLTRITEEITGGRRSGPRLFGLTDRSDGTR